MFRALRCKCPVVLGSATPSLESLKNALDGRYLHLRLPARAGGATPPKIELLDIRSAQLEAGVSPVLMSLFETELGAGTRCCCFSTGAAMPRFSPAMIAAGLPSANAVTRA